MFDYLPRFADRLLEASIGAVPIVVVDGPRGSGKTTSAERLASSVISLPHDLERLGHDPARTLAALEPPVLIDEWQLAGTDLLWELKRLVDSDPSPGRFLLAGSVEPATYGPTYPLTARAARVVIRPMTTAELDGSGDAATLFGSLIEGGSPAPTAGTDARFELGSLTRTGFPAARSLDDPGIFLDGYTALVAQRAGDEGRDASRLLATLRVLATLESQAVANQRIWESADINKATWKAYDDLITRTHLAAPSPPFASNRLKRLTGYPKRYLADTSMALRLANVTEQQLSGDLTLAGHYFESHVIQQLRPQVDLIGGSLSHLRTASGQHEVDAIIEVGLKVIAVEVKLTAAPRTADAKHLTWFRDNLDSRFHAGILVHAGGDCFQMGDRIWAVPVHHLTA